MKHQRGVSKLEFAVVVAILGILAAMLLTRLNAIEADLERIEVDLTVRHIRAGIQAAIGEHIMRGEEYRIAEIAQASPIDFLGEQPRRFNEGLTADVAGQWAYNPNRRELSYLPRIPSAFGGADELRWRYESQLDRLGKTVGIRLVKLN
ncbi:MAG: hypothetical protein K9J42_01240 [Sulfuritalea sp.]|nr:hypothetical protein [Sulfuritalea sp.]